jgi:hypothetical protein
MQEIDALGRWPYLEFLWVAGKLEPHQLYRLLGSLNVQYVNAFNAVPSAGIKLIRHSPEYSSWLYKIDSVVPRTYIVSEAIVEKEPQNVLLRLASPAFDPLSQVILSEPQPFASKITLRASAEITRYENMLVDVNAVLDAPGILVLADSYYPGWRVYVDGREEKIYRANLFFRGVKLDAGEHRVEFRYEPWSFRLGLMISLAVFGALLIVSGVLFYKRKKSALAVT